VARRRTLTQHYLPDGCARPLRSCAWAGRTLSGQCAVCPPHGGTRHHAFFHARLLPGRRRAACERSHRSVCLAPCYPACSLRSRHRLGVGYEGRGAQVPSPRAAPLDGKGTLTAHVGSVLLVSTQQRWCKPETTQVACVAPCACDTRVPRARRAVATSATPHLWCWQLRDHCGPF